MKANKLKKLMYALTMPVVLIILSATSLSVKAEGWKNDSKGYYYYYDDEGNYYKDTIAEIGNNLYYFDSNGYMVTGWYKNESGEWYYANKQGILITGWVQAEGQYFYVEDGLMARNKWVDGERYYVGSTGEMVTHNVAPYTYPDGSEAYYYLDATGRVGTKEGWKKVVEPAESAWTYVDNRGKVKEGWLSLSGKWYYIDYGVMVSGGVFEIDGKRYVFNWSGEMIVNGWFNTYSGWKYGNWVYATSTGELKTGWLKYGKSWYYFDKYSDMRTGFFSVEDASGNITKYYAKPTGELVYGWYHKLEKDNKGRIIEDYWVYTNPSTGATYTGWVKKDGQWKYVDDSIMVSRSTCICLQRDDDGRYIGSPKFEDYEDYGQYSEDYTNYIKANTYVFDINGNLVNGWYTIKTSTDTHNYYGDSNGRAYNGWIKSKGNYYYFDNGYMLSNTYTPDGYYVDYNGICQ